MAALAVIACEGESTIDSKLEDAADVIDTTPPSPDIGVDTNPQIDATDTTDAPSPIEDTGVDVTPPPQDTNDEPDSDLPPCAEVTCGDHATCEDGQCQCDDGYEGDPDQGCELPPACGQDGCSTGASCFDGDCICDPGFERGANGCELEPVSDPAGRTKTEVCQRWNDRGGYGATTWLVEPTDQCDWGVLHPEHHVAALELTTVYRWLVGLPAVTTAEQARETTQACATTLSAHNQGLTHNITSDFTCYTQEAASGAGSSNIAMGVHSAASSVPLYIGDVGVSSLGHRRWIFNPSMARTAFGYRSSYSCMYSFDRSGPANPEFVAYPAPGYFPAGALMGKWSISSNQLQLQSDTNVTIERVSDGAPVPVSDIYRPGGGYGQPTLAWSVNSSDIQKEVAYQVTIEGARSGQDVSYEVTLTSCN
jgi:hypothetical protein